MVILLTDTAERQAVGAASAVVTTTMEAGKVYAVVASVATYIRQSAGGTAAAAADDNSLIAASHPVYLHGSHGAQLTCIQASVAGDITVTQVMPMGDW